MERIEPYSFRSKGRLKNWNRSICAIEKVYELKSKAVLTGMYNSLSTNLKAQELLFCVALMKKDSQISFS